MGTLPTPSRSIDIPLRWRSVRGLAALLVFMGTFLLAGPTASAQESGGGCGSDGCVDVVAVEGIIDEIITAFVIDSVQRANDAGDVVGVVLQVDSPGVAISHQRLTELADVIIGSRVPVSVWIGASGAGAFGGAAELALVADSTGIAPGAHIGRIGTARLDPGRLGDRAPALAARTYSGQGAVDAGMVDGFDPTLVDHVGNLDWVETRVETVDGKEQRHPVPRVRLSKLPLPVQIMHTAASPSVAYLLLIIGLGLLLFEFFTAGVGVAGVVGAGFVLLAGFGLAELPFRVWALALMLVSFVALAIDMQTGMARLWTWMGFVGFVVASLLLFEEFRPGWPAMVVGVIGMAAFAFRGMPSMNRARFGTPFVGREWLVGESGVVATPLDPIGTVTVGDVDWTARALPGQRCPVGSAVTVTGSDRLTLEVRAAAAEGRTDTAN